MTVHSAAFVGTVGGCGTTRLTVELGTALARAGRTALVLDLDFDTQGLAGRVPGRLAPDSTRLLTDPDVALSEAVHDASETLGLDTSGRLDLCPAHAPFTRVAEAKSPDSAQRLSDRLADARAAGYDTILLDTPPVASNPAVAAVTDADRTVLVATPDERGVDAVQRARGRLADVGAAADAIVAPQTEAEAAPPDVDHAIPVAPDSSPTGGLDALGNTAFARAIVETAEAVLEMDLGIEVPPESRVDALRERLS